MVGDRVSFANKLIKALVRHNVTTTVEQSCVHVKYRIALISIACRYEGRAFFRTHIARGRAGICAGPSNCSRVVVPPGRGAACELPVQACVGAGRCGCRVRAFMHGSPKCLNSNHSSAWAEPMRRRNTTCQPFSGSGPRDKRTEYRTLCGLTGEL